MKPLHALQDSARDEAPSAWLADRRDQGLELFDELPMPTSDEEVWRYVDLDFSLDDLSLPSEPGAPMSDGDYRIEYGARAVIVDGYVTSATSDEQVVVKQLKDAAPEQLAAAEESAIAVDLDRFAAAHYGFGDDGLLVVAPKGSSSSRPVFIDVQAVTPDTLSLPRILLLAEDQSELSVVVTFRSPEDDTFHVVPHVQALVGEGARLLLTTVQAWGYGTTAIGQQRAVIGRDGFFHHGEAGIGSRLGRLHFSVELAGPGAHSEISGLYFGEDEQVLDYRAFITHKAPHTTSNMFLKGAVEDEAHSVFTGLIRIEEEAQKVNAYQTNRNLVLGDAAGAESVPNLEILANDVKCGHASTVGPLDEEQRYYLMSRGLDRVRSDRLQVRGFFEEALGRMPHPELNDAIRVSVNEKYVRAQEEGRQ